MSENTNWVIHWTRKHEEREYPKDAEPFLPYGTEPYQTLLNIVSTGVLKASCSYRHGSPTITKPAVCVTDMPLSEFVIYANGRLKASEYAVALPKEEFARLGGRPVIYGYFNEDNLPESVQYLKVGTGFSNGDFVDWTHEREWRWESNGSDLLLENFSEVAVIVKTGKEVEEIKNLGRSRVKKVFSIEDDLHFNWHRRFDINDL